MRIRLVQQALAAAAALASACGAPPPPGPPEVRYGEDVCRFCGMIVSDERFGVAALMSGEGGRAEMRLYDDVGCLLADLERSEAVPVQIWVKAFATGEWLEAREALFVRDEAIASPMLSGIAACASPADPPCGGRPPATLLRWDLLRGLGAAALPSRGGS
ncbi:MAG: hypothetical protein D6718_11310 [Acidobacteria bacterium]|nr:MAG: hypothetical protein D6718_11310 [Acidobacteriota bacterium]